MGLLVNGKWVDKWYDTEKTGGKFVRSESAFRDYIKEDGSSEYKAEAGRYHLYISYACPWAHRTLIFWKLKSLENIISLSVVHPYMGENGWTFELCDGAFGDDINHASYLYEIYLKSDPDYTGRVTVPVLWDKKKGCIVNNESSEIIRIFNSEFNSLGASEVDYCPEALRAEIDEINEFVYHNINNGVYKCGFATTQEAYEDAYHKLFQGLERIEQILSSRRFLVGDRITEADWRLFTTLVRFDAVYVAHFKANYKRIQDYPNLWGYTKDLYQVPGIAETVNLEHIKRHYYQSQKTINPTGIVPIGPKINFTGEHYRGESYGKFSGGRFY